MSITITMPALSPTMTEGTLAKWLVKVGDKVESGDIIAEIETDKATMEVESIDEGTVARILVEEGAQGILVNSAIAQLLEEGETQSDLEDVTAPQKVSEATVAPASEKVSAKPSPAPMVDKPIPPQSTQALTPSVGGSVGKGTQTGRVIASPLARRLAKEAGFDLQQVKGTGPHGRIVKADIEKTISQGGIASKTAPIVQPQTTTIPGDTTNPFEGPYELVKASSMRKVIAQRLTLSKQTIPHYYLSMDINLDRLLKLRKKLNIKGEGKYRISVNDFVIKAVALALKSCPDANSSWTNEGIKYYKHADVAVAVAIEGGLITPVVRRAEEIGLATISSQVKALAKKAKEGTLQPQEYQGGSFSVSNLGMFGISSFAAVINPPQGGILSIGAGVEKPVVKNGKIKIATIMNITLAADHRAIDGAVGATFLQYVKGYLEEPLSMIL